ncbi:MAG: metal-sensing transcriptional repressor [Candidatus Moranbacteria bacterium]|nr:metal-sensing transcriptional repressor [Candidatus Moranbacteria bacterium]
MSQKQSVDKQKVLIALKKARTSLDKIIEMLEGDKKCFDVIQQNLAVIGLLKSANLSILEKHLNECDALQSSKKSKDLVRDILKVVNTAQSK